MAGVNVQLIGTGILQPNQFHYWLWHNATTEKVWWFSADVFVTKYTSIFPGTRKVEITDVEYRLELKPDLSQEHQVLCWIKNTGAWEARYELRMAFAPAG